MLVAAGLLVRSVDRMSRAASGVDAAGVLTVALEPDGPAYQDWAATARFHATVVDTLRGRAGVDAVGAVGALPLQTGYRMRFSRPDRPQPAASQNAPVQHISVDAGYFETVRATLVAGRFFDATDVAGSEPVMVINQTMARLAFGNEPAIGHTIVPAAVSIGPFGYNLSGRVPHRVIGIIADIQQADLQKPSQPAMYFSVRQFPSKTMYVTARGPGVSVALVREAVRSVDPSVPIGRVEWLQDWMLTQSAPARLLMLVLTAFAVLMAVTAAGGLYSLLAWMVNRRRREIAIRQALGATASTLARRVAAEALSLAGAGALVGVLLAGAAARGLESFLFRTSPTDPTVLVAAVAVVLIAAAAAAVGPAHRALRVNPVEGLREDG